MTAAAETFQPARSSAVALPLLGVYLLFALIVAAGTLVFIVPGIILTTIYIVSMPIAVQERRRVLGSLGRAARLSKGYRPTLFVIGLGYLGTAIAPAAPGPAAIPRTRASASAARAPRRRTGPGVGPHDAP
jgi:hypothetical protein